MPTLRRARIGHVVMLVVAILALAPHASLGTVPIAASTPSGRDQPATGESDVAGVDVRTLPTTLRPESLTDFTFLPNGDLLVAGRAGIVKRVTARGKAVTLARLDVETSVNRGLSSITLAPDYERSGKVYTLASYRDGEHLVARLERFVVDDPGAPRALRRESVVIDGMPDDGYGHHTVGAVRIAPDGTLLVSKGDEGNPGEPKPSNFRALDPGYPGGKILRVTPNGEGVPDNPFYDPATPDGWPSRVYALGLRNPFRFAIRPETGAMYVGDVGALARETLAVVTSGTNLGWPCFEGGQPQEVTHDGSRCAAVVPPTAPMWTYERPTSPDRRIYTAIIAGVFPGRGSRWTGQHVFADFSRGNVYALPLDPQDRLTSAVTPAVIAHGTWLPVSFALDPDGNVCFADYATSTVRCLVEARTEQR